MESLVSFKNGQLELRGILHVPNCTQDKVGVILLCPGYKHRVGQRRLYVQIARRLRDAGFYVLRYDFHGLGESDGEIRRCLFGDFWDFVQTGGFVSDTRSAVDFFRDVAKMEKLILMGLCGGAITGIIEAAKDSRVDGLVLLNVPVMAQHATRDWFIDRMPPGLADSLFSAYVKRLLSVQSWLRFLTFKTEYRVLWKSITSKFSRRYVRSSRSGPENEECDDAVNPHFVRSFRSYCSSKRPLLFIFSGNDKQKWAFEAEFQQRYLHPGNPYEDSYSIFVIDRANHSFTLQEWRDALLEKTVTWLQDHLNGGTGTEHGQTEASRNGEMQDEEKIVTR